MSYYFTQPILFTTSSFILRLLVPATRQDGEILAQ